MNKIRVRQRAPIVILVALVLAIGSFLITKQIKAYLALNKSLQQIEAQLDQLAGLQENLLIEKEKLATSQAALQSYSQYFHHDLHKGQLLTILGEQSTNHQVTITNITPQQPIKTQYYQQQPINMTIKGKYNNILLYLAWLENLTELPNYSEIVAFTITPAEGAKQLDPVECNLTLVLYTAVDPTEEEELYNHGKNGGQ